MKLPLSWLNEYVKADDLMPEELALKLLSIGFEVEEIIYFGADIINVVTGKIVKIEPHPDATKLRICTVKTGDKSQIIITGAANVQEGDIVPVALDGAILPGNKKIVASPLRGIMSYGMLCAGKELNIDNTVVEGAEVDGILILPSNTPVGKDICEILRLKDCVLDVSVTANRPDCQCVYGMAREIATLLNRPIKPLNLEYSAKKGTSTPISAKVENENACSRYTGQLIEKVAIGRSPDFIRDRLRRVGIRAINNLVDITNYVLMEVGQPLHAFDSRFVAENRIIVRSAQENEKIIALDGKEYTLKNSMLVIADCEKPLAIAGVMGGEYTGILSDTKTVFLESARFSKGSIRATSRALGLRSDSSARYEKGVDWNSVDVGRKRALALIDQLGAGAVTQSYCSDQIETPKEKVIETSARQICAILGIEISKQAIVDILKSLSFNVSVSNEKMFVTAPVFREDIDNYTDLAEEVIRFYGYDNIQSTLLKSASTTIGGLSERQHIINDIKSMMCGLNLYEITTYSFINQKVYDKLCVPKSDTMRDTIRILNPLSEEYSVMRTQMAANMLSTVSLNLSRKNKAFGLFEVGKTYIPKSLPLKDLPTENETLCIALVGKNEDFYSLKNIVTQFLNKYTPQYELSYSSKCYLHPGISADIKVNDTIIGWMGKVHPLVLQNYELNEDVYLAEIDLESILKAPLQNIKHVPLPKFPAVERDLAVIVEKDCLVGDIMRVVKQSTDLCGDVKLFDVYQGAQIEKGYKSVAFSFKLQSPTKTLEEQEIQEAVDSILHNLQKELNAKLR